MTTRTKAEIDFSTFPVSDGEPMAETLANRIQMIDLIETLDVLLRGQGRTRAIVSGNQFIYYNPANGREHVSPDVFVVFDRDPPAPPKWQTWVEGKFPEIVFEISSESTTSEDVGDRPKDKPALYQRLGAQEYVIYDPQGDVQPALQGFGWEGGQWVRRALLPSGGLWSPLLGAELRAQPMAERGQRPAGVWLRVLDPETGEPIPLAEEEVIQAEAARRVAEEHAAAEATRAAAAEDRAQHEGRTRRLAEEHAATEAARAAAAEERVRQFEERLRRLGQAGGDAP